MTRHVADERLEDRLRFYLTASAPCPYLPGRLERKVFVNLPFSDGARVNDSLTQGGFRRSQNIVYRPACDACEACVSVRIPVADFVFSRSHARTLNRNAHLTRAVIEAEATTEQFDLLRRYLGARHPDGGMNDMGWLDYRAMVEDSSARTHLVEYRQPSRDGGPGDLAGVVLADRLADGLSLVYSFYDPGLARRSPGVFAVLDHLRQAAELGLPHVYLGYWVRGSKTMDYKSRFWPLEGLTRFGWTLLPAPRAETG